MAIQIVRNEDGNCIEFRGSSNPVYYNACLSAEIDATFTDTLNVINDVATSAGSETVYEFYQIAYTEFRDANNETATATPITKKTSPNEARNIPGWLYRLRSHS